LGKGLGEGCKGKVLTLRPSGPPDLSPFEVINVPLLELKPALDAEGLREALKEASAVLFTSVTGVNLVFTTLPDIANKISKMKVFAIGPRTAKELEKYGIKAIIPKTYTSEGVAEMLKEEGKVVAIRSDRASRVLKDALGPNLVEVVAYKTIRLVKPDIHKFIKNVDAVVVSSAEMGRALLESLKAGKLDAKEVFSRVPLVVIGPEAAKPFNENKVPYYLSEEATFEGVRRKLLELLCGDFRGST